MYTDLLSKKNASIISRVPDVAQPEKRVTPAELLQMATTPLTNEDLLKRDFLIGLYGKIMDEYNVLMGVLRRRALANKNTNMVLKDSGDIQAAQVLFGQNVKAMTFDRYLDLLKLEKDLQAICAQDAIDEGIL